MEIGACILLCRHIYQVARDKNYNPIGFIIGTICTWLIAEGVAGAVSLYFVRGLFFVYIASLVGGCLGGLLWLMIIHIVPSHRYNPEERIIFDAYRLRHLKDPTHGAEQFHATHDLSSEDTLSPPSEAAASTDNESQKVCPICLEPTEKDAEFCRTCGYRLAP